jgi:hypothetical protein
MFLSTVDSKHDKHDTTLLLPQSDPLATEDLRSDHPVRSLHLSRDRADPMRYFIDLVE